MVQIVECVPNFSEGRDKKIIDAITAAIAGTEGVVLLDVDPGADTNRTVVTFIGPPEPIKEAAFRAIKKAAELIDMSKHSGAHPRMGATDVCPFVPVAGVSMQDCVEIANQVGQRVGLELGIPVYLYEAAATKPERESLATIRQGEYEGLPAKLSDPDWRPDYGPAVFNARAGATVIGAREFLIAYNVNLNTIDKKLAHKIAVRIREGGRAARDDEGKIIRNESGETVKIPGTLKHCRAVGWVIPEYGCAQVSINLTNYHVTPPHQAFEQVRAIADEFGLLVTGSELVGLIPLEAMLMAGRYFLEKQGKTPAVPEAELVRVASQSLGLSSITPFEPSTKIIEYRMLTGRKALVDLTVDGFVDELSSDSPAPGGGSVAALSGGLSAALVAMVAALTHSKDDYKAVCSEIVAAGLTAQDLKKAFQLDIDRDTEAFNQVMAALRLPKKTPEQQAVREQALVLANKQATQIPFGVLKRSLQLFDLVKLMVDKGNQNSLSDSAVGGLAAQMAAEGAYYNVLINLAGIADQDYVKQVRTEAEALRDLALAQSEEIRANVLIKLASKSE